MCFSSHFSLKNHSFDSQCSNCKCGLLQSVSFAILLLLVQLLVHLLLWIIFMLRWLAALMLSIALLCVAVSVWRGCKFQVEILTDYSHKNVRPWLCNQHRGYSLRQLPTQLMRLILKSRPRRSIWYPSQKLIMRKIIGAEFSTFPFRADRPDLFWY